MAHECVGRARIQGYIGAHECVGRARIQGYMGAHECVGRARIQGYMGVHEWVGKLRIQNQQAGERRVWGPGSGVWGGEALQYFNCQDKTSNE